MPVIKKKTRKKLSKQLRKLLKKHGAEGALALVSGLVTAIAAREEAKEKKVKVRPRAAKPVVRVPILRKRQAV